MSRSYRKHPFNTDGNMRRSGKKFANDRVRNSDFDEIGSGGSYKKVYEQADTDDAAETFHQDLKARLDDQT